MWLTLSLGLTLQELTFVELTLQLVSGDTTPCKVTPCKVTSVILHGAVSPNPWKGGNGLSSLSASGCRSRPGVSLCEDRIGTGPPRARTDVVYVDLANWAIARSIHPKGDPRSWGINSSVFGIEGLGCRAWINVWALERRPFKG